jgi:hypothetical protein
MQTCTCKKHEDCCCPEPIACTSDVWNLTKSCEVLEHSDLSVHNEFPRVMWHNRNLHLGHHSSILNWI